LTYQIEDNYISLSAKTESARSAPTQTPQQRGITVTGTVSDVAGAPIPYVAVAIPGTSTSTLTNENGEFSITVPDRESVLQFTSMGYETVTQTVGDRRILPITMTLGAIEMDNVTVVAFGTQKKTSLVSSIESVNISQLKQPTSNLTASFAGRIPGLISYQTTGEPGSDNAQFFIRGVTTFGYKTSPLILIDGFEASSDDLARLQPDDIESFSILKDASATVLYGARGANGIIMVTTKAGREGGPFINVRLDMNTASPTKILETVDGVEYMRLYNQALATRDKTGMLPPFYNEQKIQSTISGENPMIYPNVDWYSTLFKNNTINTKANINVSGGGSVASYYVSGGFDNETGLLKVDGRNNFNNNINIDRFNIRNNVIFNMGKWTKLDVRLSGRFEKFTGPAVSASDIFGMVMNSNPVDFPAVFEPDAANEFTEHTLFGSTYINSSVKFNPYAEMVRGYESRDESTMTAMATLSHNLDYMLEGLKFQAKASVNTWSKYTSTRSYNPYYYAVDEYNQITGEYTLYNLNPTSGQAYLGDVQPGRDASVHYYFEGRLNWEKQYGKHNLGAMTVFLAEENLLTSGNSNSIYETLPERNLGNSGRVTYGYDDRYLFEFSYGWNGSEKFTGEKQFGFFPSVGAAWVVSNESFMQGAKSFIDILKFRFTYGRVGNDAISDRAGRFFFLSEITKSGGSYRWGTTFDNSFPGYSTRRYANPDITWEVSTKYNLGVELALFRGGPLKIQVDFFKDIRSNIYMVRENFPATAGLEAPISGNVGEVGTQGIDGSIDLQHFFNNDFWITGRANFSYSVNKYLKIDEKNYPYDYLKRLGRNINQQSGLIAERLFADDYEVENSPRQEFGAYSAGDIKYTDVNGDGVVNSNDRVFMGHPTVPEIQYGFGLSVGYKKFDFSFFFQGNGRSSFFIDAGSGGIAPFSGRRNALAIVAEDVWSETDPDIYAFWPRLSSDPTENNVQQSSWWLRSNSFLRLKTVEAGWNFGGIKKVGLQNCRVYLSAENLFCITPFKLWDPEVGRHGLGYPLSRRLNVGAQLSF
jgi:TonB-linked SusC/RagA family outer membrane protein